MASVTRSTRRAEGLHPHHASVHGHHLTPSVASAGLFHQAGGRNKRALDASDRDFDPIKHKKTRITVEILGKGPLSLGDAVRVSPVEPPRPRPAIVRAKPPSPTTTPAPTEQATPAAKGDQNLTKHQAKVINGIKHELDRLQPQPSDTRDQGRKLRSQEATRFRSELSAYFPEYDEVIGNETREQHVLNIDTPIAVIDSDARRAIGTSQRVAQRPRHADHVAQYPVRGYGDALFSDLFDAQSIDFNFLEAQFKNKSPDDPLPDTAFRPVHRRAERLERSIRNTEKGRAQHEKDQIIRLLEGLQGHDWLRIMGVSGITETKKKAFEPARDHFIKGCQAILGKFRNWILEEKRRKQEKEKALAERAGEEEEGPAQSDDELHNDEPGREDSTDSATPAKQLREEALARSKGSGKSSKKQRSTPQPQIKPPASKGPVHKAAAPKPPESKPPESKPPVSKAAPPKLAAPKVPKLPKPPEPLKEFNSFFAKRYERDGALNRHRRAGRKVMAWGQVIPEIPELDFTLPEEYRDPETMKARERKKRRDRRGSKN